jgi:hypothetical protein
MCSIRHLPRVAGDRQNTRTRRSHGRTGRVCSRRSRAVRSRWMIEGRGVRREGDRARASSARRRKELLPCLRQAPGLLERSGSTARCRCDRRTDVARASPRLLPTPSPTAILRPRRQRG